MTSMPPPQPPDDEHDAWLREALRHAPDAEAAPPAALSALILREAQIKLWRPAPAAAPSIRKRLWMWSARPSVGAGLASVMLAGVIAGIWWDRPMHENTPRATMEPMRAEAPAPQREAAAPAAAPATPEASTRVATAERAAESQVGTSVSAPAPATDAAARSRPRAADALSKTARTLDMMASPTPPAPRATPPAAAPFSAPDEAAAGRAAATARTPRVARELRQRALPGAAEHTFGDLLITLAADPAAWSWQRGDGAVQPVGDTLTAWLAEVDTLAAGRWNAGASAVADSAWRPLQLLHQGRVVHRLGFDGALLRWEIAGAAARVWQAPIDRAQAEQLRLALERFAP